MEEVFEFRSGEHQLTGILNVPAGASSGADVAVLFANAGARGRLGSTFQYPYYARQLAELGIPSLRFDPHGIGDSEGLLETREMLAFYGVLQQGLFVEDLLVAIEEFRRRVRPRRLVLCGVCGGAITSLIAAGKADVVDGVILLSVPVLLDSAAEDEAEVIPAGYAREYLIAAYGKKIFSLDAWSRLLSGKSELDTIARYSAAILKGGIERARGLLDPRQLADQLRRRMRTMRAGRHKVTHEAERHPMFNERFLESLDALMGRRAPVLLVFGEGDAIRWHFEEHFQKPFWQDDPAYAELCEVHYLAGCNHLFTLKEWQDRALDLARPWLSRLQAS